MINVATALHRLEQIRRLAVPLFLFSLGWLLWAVFGDIYTIRARPTNSSSLPGGTEIAFSDRRPLQEYVSVARQRDMFRQSVVYQTKETEVVDVLGDLVFLGIVRTGDKVRAFIQNTTTSQSTLYSVGESIGDITVKEIRDDRIVLSHGEEVLELTK